MAAYLYEPATSLPRRDANAPREEKVRDAHGLETRGKFHDTETTRDPLRRSRRELSSELQPERNALLEDMTRRSSLFRHVTRLEPCGVRATRQLD